MDFSVITVGLVTKLLLLLLIGMGPKIALVPFLEKTKRFDADTQRAIGRQMVGAAVITALIMFAFGALLMRLLHITGGAVAVAGGIILVTLAIEMHRGLSAGGAVSAQPGRHHRADHFLRRGRLGCERRARRSARSAGRRVRLCDLCQHRQGGKTPEAHQSDYFRSCIWNPVDRCRSAIGRRWTEFARDYRHAWRRALDSRRSCA